MGNKTSMRLYYWMTCPFACKVLAFLDELGMKDSVELVQKHPWEKNNGLSALNPLKQIPVLEVDAGFTLFDSRVICEYLDQFSEGKNYIPKGGIERWKTLKLQAIADGIMEAAIYRVIEENARHEEHRSDPWIGRQNVKLIQALDFLEKDSLTFENNFTLGHLAVAIALSYLNLRFAKEAWGEKRLNLLKWHKQIMERPSLRDNRPHEIHALPESFLMEHLT